RAHERDVVRRRRPPRRAGVGRRRAAGARRDGRPDSPGRRGAASRPAGRGAGARPPPRGVAAAGAQGRPRLPAAVRGPRAPGERGLRLRLPPRALAGRRGRGHVPVKVLVTGAHGKVGRALVPALMRAGHDVRATDLTLPTWDRLEDPREAEDYWQVDLTDVGSVDALVRGCDAVVHTAAIPQPLHHAPSVVFGNNLMATFNLLEAAIAAGVGRFVNFSSETVPGFIFVHRPFEPDYLPIDEDHPVRPQDSYATAKWFGELLMERAPERADIATISIRPCW